MRLRIAFCSTVLPAFLLLSLGVAQAESTYIVAAALIDPVNEKVISNPLVEIQAERIVAVTSGSRVPERSTVIDLGEG